MSNSSLLIKGIAAVRGDEDYSNCIDSAGVERILKLGISQKRRLSAGKSVADLASEAVLALGQNHDLGAADYLIVCNQTPDLNFPGIASTVQVTCFSDSIPAIDVFLGCSGFVYCLSLAYGLLVSNQATNIVVVTADRYSGLIENGDPLEFIFGDSATATLVCLQSSSRKQQFIMGTDGAGRDHLYARSQKLFMNGIAVLEFTMRVVPEAVKTTLNTYNMTGEDIDSFVFHQANELVLDMLGKKLDISSNKIYRALDGVGNTTSSTIPIALARYTKAANRNSTETVHTVLICGFGVGLSWASTILQIDPSVTTTILDFSND